MVNSEYDLYLERWSAQKARARLVIAHGVGEHIGRYSGLGRYLSDQGIDCVGHDHRGHGRSPGQRGHIGRFADYVDDLAALVAAESRCEPRLPIFLLGHSMGSIVALRLAERRTGALAGLVLTGVALEPAAWPPRWLVSVVLALGRVIPRLPLFYQIPAAGLSQDVEVQRQYLRDPLASKRVSAGWVGAFDRARRLALEEAASLELPLLLIHGADDPVVRPAGARALADRVASVDKRLVVLGGQRHEVLNEVPELREKTLELIREWVIEHA